MHNIDRTNFESTYGEYGEFEQETPRGYAGESPFSEIQEMELAAELLNVQSEAELEQFLGKLIKKAGGFLKSPIGQQLTGALKGVAKTALPTIAGAAGNFILPGIGGQIGSQLGSIASSLFELELEGMSFEDQQFEVAKQVVRLSGAAASNAAQAPQSVPAVQAAQSAVATAARQFAPGLLRTNGGPTSPAGQVARSQSGTSGRWIKRGNSIILLGV